MSQMRWVSLIGLAKKRNRQKKRQKQKTLGVPGSMKWRIVGVRGRAGRCQGEWGQGQTHQSSPPQPRPPAPEPADTRAAASTQIVKLPAAIFTLYGYLYWNVPCGDTSSKTLIDVCVCVRRHIAKLRQEWFNGLSWNFVGMLGVTMPRMYQILVTNQLNLTN